MVQSYKDVRTGDRLRVMASVDEFKKLVESTSGADHWGKRSAALCGKVGVVIRIYKDDTLVLEIDGGDKTPWIPVKVRLGDVCGATVPATEVTRSSSRAGMLSTPFRGE